MRSISACRAYLASAEIHPALRSFADECHGVIVCLLAYIGALAVLAIAGNNLLAGASVSGAETPTVKAGWAPAPRSYPAFAVTQADSSFKTEVYDILRHPDGGRRDVIRWAVAAGEKPIAEIEMYRRGTESNQAGPPAAEIAARMDPDELREVEAAGVIGSKFGYVALLGFAGDSGEARSCLGFMKNLEDANLRISGWSCQAGPPAVRRAAISCILDRLVLLTAGNDPKLAGLFAHAELRRGLCGTAAAAKSADWVTGAPNRRLRGRL